MNNMDEFDENGYIIEPEELQQEYESSFFLMLSYDVLTDNRLSDFQKLLFAAITGLCRKNGYCWASNAYFEKLFNKSKSQVNAGITKLVELGYLRRELMYKKKLEKDGTITITKQISFRKLYIVISPNKDTGIPENKDRGIPENKEQIDNPLIDNPTSNSISKDISLEDNTETVVQDIEIDFNSLDEDNEGTVDSESFSKDGSEDSTNTPPPAADKKKKGGLAPLYDMADEKYPSSKYNLLNAGLKTYLKAHLGKRRLPSIEKWEDMLERLEQYSSVQLPGAVGNKFMEPKAIEIVEKAINGKDGIPYLDFDDIYHSVELKEPTFNLNRDFTKGY